MAELPEDLFSPEILSLLYDDSAPVPGPFDLEDLAPSPCNHDDPYPPNRGEELSEQPPVLERKRAKSGVTSAKRAFARPKTQEEIGQAKKSSIPATTMKDTRYCVGVWNEWRNYRMDAFGEDIAALKDLEVEKLATCLSNLFLMSGKRMEWSFLQIHSITLSAGVTGKASIDIFKVGEFAEFRACLDAEMKRLQRNGLGSQTKKAEPLSEEEEEMLWSKGIIGKHSPQSLVDTVLFMSGLYFALRSGQEHRQLRAEPCQIILHERPGERPYLEYEKDISKNRSGGLRGSYSSENEVSALFMELRS